MSLMICINKGVKWWGSLFKNEGLSTSCWKSFEKNLKQLMFLKMKDHWFPGSPKKGQGFRSIMVDTMSSMDPLLKTASKDIFDVGLYLPSGTLTIVMWVDPGYVSVKVTRLFLDGKVRDSENEVFRCDVKKLNMWDYDIKTGLPTSFEITCYQESTSKPSQPSYSDKLKMEEKKVKSVPKGKGIEGRKKRKFEEKEDFPSLPSDQQQRDVPAVSDLKESKKVKGRYNLRSSLVKASDPIVDSRPMEEGITYSDIESGLISLMKSSNLIQKPKEETEEDSRIIIVNEGERRISLSDQPEDSQITNIESCTSIENGSKIPIQNNNVHLNEQNSSIHMPLYSDKVKCKPEKKSDSHKAVSKHGGDDQNIVQQTMPTTNKKRVQKKNKRIVIISDCVPLSQIVWRVG